MTEKREALKNQLAQNAGGAVQEKPKTPQALVGDYIKKMMPTMQQVLPKHMDADRMARIALNVIRTNPLLLQCNMPSLMGAVMESAKLGLEPGMLGQAYILPFKNYKASKEAGRDVYEAQWILGYRGMIDLVRRSGQVSSIRASVIHENDDYEIIEGLDANLIHKPLLSGDRGAPVIFYAVAVLKDGSKEYQWMSKTDVDKHRDKYSKAKNYGPWVDSYDEMAKKTVLRRLVKYLPISVEFLSNDEQNGVTMHNSVADDEDVIEVDQETGEILGNMEIN